MSPSTLVGFAAYQIDTFEECPLVPMVYLYEIQVVHKRRGFGTRLMKEVERAGREALSSGLAEEGLHYEKRFRRRKKDSSSPQRGGSPSRGRGASLRHALRPPRLLCRPPRRERLARRAGWGGRAAARRARLALAHPLLRAPRRGLSDVSVHPNGRFLYAGVRSTEPHGSIAIFEIDEDADGVPIPPTAAPPAPSAALATGSANGKEDGETTPKKKGKKEKSTKKES